MVKAGLANLAAHIEIVKQSGVTPVVCLNTFVSDTPEEIEQVKMLSESMGVRFAVSEHWSKGGEGALALADTVIAACDEKSEFKFLYETELPLSQKIERIAKQIYGAQEVIYTPEAQEKLKKLEVHNTYKSYACCMAKTHLSLSDQPHLKGRPKNWTLHIRDLLVYQGAGFIVPVAGDIKLMPGTASDPAYRRIDVDTETGKVTGLF